MRLTNLLCSRTYKGVVALQKNLQPSAPIHQEGSVAKLRKLVQDAADLLSNLPFKPSLDISSHLAIGSSGIFEARRRGTKSKSKSKSKPALVVENELEDWYEG